MLKFVCIKTWFVSCTLWTPRVCEREKNIQTLRCVCRPQTVDDFSPPGARPCIRQLVRLVWSENSDINPRPQVNSEYFWCTPLHQTFFWIVHLVGRLEGVRSLAARVDSFWLSAENGEKKNLRSKIWTVTFLNSTPLTDSTHPVTAGLPHGK